MNINRLEGNMWMYHIPAMSETRLGQNICILIDGNQGLFIDAGYIREATLVLDDLKSKGIEVVKVVPTHFHPDHVEGITLLNNPTVYGNEFAIKTLKRFYKQGIEEMTPTSIIDDQSVIEFGEFRLTFEHAPGHSDCSMLININDKYIHLGDLYLRLDNGAEVLPYVTWKGVVKHLESFEKILKHSDKIPLISHGVSPTSEADLLRGIEDRRIYLKALLKTKNRATAKEATNNCSRPFEFLHWRKDVE